MEIKDILVGVLVSLITYGIIESFNFFFRFKVKAWVIPIFLFVGFLSRPFIVDFFDSDDLKTITEKTYNNERVELDGFEYVRCKFIDCKLVYRGKKHFGLTSNDIIGRTQFYFDEDASTSLRALKKFYGSGESFFKFEVMRGISSVISPDKLLIVDAKKDTLSLEKLELELYQN